jgi:hypothetical protein
MGARIKRKRLAPGPMPVMVGREVEVGERASTVQYSASDSGVSGIPDKVAPFKFHNHTQQIGILRLHEACIRKDAY